MPKADADIVAKHVASPLVARNLEALLESIYYILRNGNPAEHVIVFDIDDTLLFNPSDSQVSRSGNPYLGFRNKHIADVHDAAKRAGYKIHFITARSDSHFSKPLQPEVLEANAARTKKQLAQLGMEANEQNLILRPLSVSSTREEVGAFKQSSRALIAYTDKSKKLRARPKTILLNFGDQWSDLTAADETEYDALRRVFRGFNVLFRPDPDKEPFTRYAVKLLDARER